MKFFSKTISVKTKKPFDFVQIDQKVKEVVKKSEIKSGFVLLRSYHNTATILCNENDPTVLQDLEKILRKLLPDGLSWSHTYEGINNARAHQAVNLLGHTHWVPLEDGQLKLGTWQSLFLIEFFEARTRKVAVVIVGV
jgi:secondary thiamine-phosphate synthase enzyme